MGHVLVQLQLGLLVAVGTLHCLEAPEARTHSEYKKHLMKAKSSDTVVTKSFTGHRLRALRNKWTIEYEKNPEKLEKIKSMQLVKSTRAGAWKLHSGVESGPNKLDLNSIDMDTQAFVTGQCIGAIQKLIPAAEIVTSMTQDAARILTKHEDFKISKL